MRLFLSVILVLTGMVSFAGDDIYPAKPNPPRLVNDFAHMLNSSEAARLENKLVSFARTTSTQISVVTITNLGGHDVAEYATRLFNIWGIGEAGKNNGVLMLVSLEDRKAFIATGTGLQGVLTDAKTSRIFRNELRPAFKEGNYAEGLEKCADAIIAVTKDEYKADKTSADKGAPPGALIVLIIFIILIIAIKRKGGGGGGGYMSNRGVGDFATGWLIGSLLNRGGGGNDWGGSNGGGSDWGGGDFGGFGGGGTDGGGAGGSW